MAQNDASKPPVKGKKQPKSTSKAAEPHNKTTIPLYQSLGLSLSEGFMTAVSSTQANPAKVLQNLGFRPSMDCCESLSGTTWSNDSSASSSDGISQSSSTTISSTSTSSSAYKKQKRKYDGMMFTLGDFVALEALETLIARYGRACHMGVRDPSYSFFLNQMRTGALYYKLRDKVAVLGGDPLCPPSEYVQILEEFAKYCKKHGWTFAIMGASDVMAAIAKEKSWVTLQFGVERVLNPMTNAVLLGKGGKRIQTQCKQLLKAGISVDLYCQSYQSNPQIEAEILQIYESWRSERNTTRACQAFMTVFDLFTLPRLMAFVYTKDQTGKVNGFAALRKLNNGYHIDPYIAAADAPRGITDLLLFASMAFLKEAGISYLSLGFEPLTELKEVTGMPKLLVNTTRNMYRHIFGKLPVGGKEGFHSRFYPDEEQEGGLHLIFPRTPRPKDMFAMAHFANISLRSVLKDDLPKFMWGAGGQVVGKDEVVDKVE